jgi:hypothetical protein
MSLEAYRNRLRTLEHLARKIATSAECPGSRQPELIQIAMHFHPAEGAPSPSAIAQERLPANRGSYN